MKNFTISIILTSIIAFGLHAQTHYGTSAGTVGPAHSHFGSYAGNSSTSASGYNSFMGASSGRNIADGDRNAGLGTFTLFNNTSGSDNTAAGSYALYSNTSGQANVAIGRNALKNIEDRDFNVANGYQALYSNAASENIAVGSWAMPSNTTGADNIAIGYRALFNNLTSHNNIATGYYALSANTTGYENCAFGSSALGTVAGGSRNSAFGFNAGINLCPTAPLSGSFNTFFGAYTGVAPSGSCDLSNTVAVGYSTLVTASNQARFGNASVTSIGGQVSWSTLSDGRFKKDIKKDIAGLEFITQLNPVSYIIDKNAYEKFIGVPESIRIQSSARETPHVQIGFVAQDVEAIVKKSGYVFSGIVAPQHENDPYTIRYAEFVIPLTKAVQELSLIANERQKKIEELKKALRPYLEETTGVREISFDSNGAEINLTLNELTADASVIIYDIDGRQLKEIMIPDRGATMVRLFNSEFIAGNYYYALIADGKVMDADEIIIK